MEALVAADDNYNSAATEKLFEIKKAIPSYTLPQELLIKQGEALSSVQLPTGFTWVDPAQKAEILGAQTFKAIFTPTDTMNYESVEVNIHLNVVPQGTPINAVPSIHAEDKILTIGDAFDVMAGVSAQDAEDGDLSAAIEVVKNTVDLAKPGVYEVTYRVTDRAGAFATKTITVTVQEKTQEQPTTPVIPTTPDEGSGSGHTESNVNQNTVIVQTGDEMSILAWSSIAMISLAGMILMLF